MEAEENNPRSGESSDSEYEESDYGYGSDEEAEDEDGDEETQEGDDHALVAEGVNLSVPPLHNQATSDGYSTRPPSSASHAPITAEKLLYGEESKSDEEMGLETEGEEEWKERVGWRKKVRHSSVRTYSYCY